MSVEITWRVEGRLSSFEAAFAACAEINIGIHPAALRSLRKRAAGQRDPIMGLVLCLTEREAVSFRLIMDEYDLVAEPYDLVLSG